MLAIALDAIPRAQGRSLVGAAQRVEGLSRDAGSVLGPAMVGAENRFVSAERGFGEAQCFSRLTRGDQQASKMPNTRDRNAARKAFLNSFSKLRTLASLRAKTVLDE